MTSRWCWAVGPAGACFGTNPAAPLAVPPVDPHPGSEAGACDAAHTHTNQQPDLEAEVTRESDEEVPIREPSATERVIACHASQ